MWKNLSNLSIWNFEHDMVYYDNMVILTIPKTKILISALLKDKRMNMLDESFFSIDITYIRTKKF